MTYESLRLLGGANRQRRRLFFQVGAGAPKILAGLPALTQVRSLRSVCRFPISVSVEFRAVGGYSQSRQTSSPRWWWLIFASKKISFAFPEARNQFSRLNSDGAIVCCYSAVLVFDFRKAFGDRTRRQRDFFQTLKTLGKKFGDRGR